LVTLLFSTDLARRKAMHKLPLLSTLSGLILLALVFSTGCQAQPIPKPVFTPVPIPTATLAPAYPPVPYELISETSLFGYLEGLTSIQPYSGWRNTGSSGEAEALDYVAGKLGEFSNLKSAGLELERQSYKIFITSELWEARLRLTVQGQEIEVPANGLRGARYDPQLALSLDSDGKSNDSERNPVNAAGLPLLVRDAETFNALTVAEAKDRILFLDYAIIDTVVNPDYPANGEKLMKLINLGLDGVVLVTRYSNTDGESRGTFVGDGGVFQYFDHVARIPILHARLEDLEPAGIQTWEDLARIETARLTWDADIFIPGQGGNLIAHLPGRDSSRAVILTAHVDSPNSPGVFDDGSGSAILLEVARVLNVSQTQPAVDLYLVWFGGHELMTYGSAHFVATHQELLDRTLGMLGVDGVGHGLDGKLSEITLSFTPYGKFGEERAPWQDFIVQTMAPYELSPKKHIVYGLVADNSNFDAFNVPNFNLYNLDSMDWQTRGGAYIHYASHWHDPYETVEVAREVSGLFTDVTKIALTAALETGRSPTDFRVTPHPERRALFIASHTESDTIAPGMLQGLGMALAWEGFDVDLLPYGQPLTPADLENVGIIVLLPTLDYPGPNFETWSQAEFDLLTGYLAQGGFLVVTNSAYNLASTRQVEDLNEDATDFNALLEPLGIKFSYGNLGGGIVRLTANHPLAADAKYLTSVYEGLQVPLTQQGGLVLAPGVIGLADYGSQGGQVLVIADLSLLRDNADGAKNLNFVKNIARYARSR
jgi:hypothetical protein